jgi:hypothetical protein
MIPTRMWATERLNVTDNGQEVADAIRTNKDLSNYSMEQRALSWRTKTTAQHHPLIVLWDAMSPQAL